MSEATRRRILDPFDAMRSTRALAPHDPKLNDIRWLTGEALRRVNARANGLCMPEFDTQASNKLAAAELTVGPTAWPIVKHIVIEGVRVRDCRSFVPEVITPWRADAVITDRLRVALDQLGPLLGVTIDSTKGMDVQT
jgi:hypothetical protein